MGWTVTHVPTHQSPVRCHLCPGVGHCRARHSRVARVGVRSRMAARASRWRPRSVASRPRPATIAVEKQLDAACFQPHCEQRLCYEVHLVGFGVSGPCTQGPFLDKAVPHLPGALRVLARQINSASRVAVQDGGCHFVSSSMCRSPRAAAVGVEGSCRAAASHADRNLPRAWPRPTWQGPALSPCLRRAPMAQAWACCCSRSAVATSAASEYVRGQVQAERRMKARISTSIPMERP